MYCSNCGASEQTPKTYCRHCGTWIGTGRPEERITVMIVFNALSALFAAIAAIVLFLTQSGRLSGTWAINLAATFCLIISVYQTLSFLFALNLRSRLKQGQETPAEIESRKVLELKKADSSAFIQPHSVTENTTELLERKSK
jgi:hypothetical protein